MKKIFRHRKTYSFLYAWNSIKNLPDSFSCELSIIAMFIESFASVASIDSLLFVSSEKKDKNSVMNW